MKLVRFLHSGVESYGLLVDKGILNLPFLSRIKEYSLPLNLEGLVSLGREGIQAVKKAIQDSSEREMREATLRREDVTLLAPLPSPPKILCLGLNYRDHAEEGKAKIPDEPIIFMKPKPRLLSPGDSVEIEIEKIGVLRNRVVEEKA